MENIFNLEKSKVCCFSGHRPQNLPWGFGNLDERYVKTMPI